MNELVQPLVDISPTHYQAIQDVIKAALVSSGSTSSEVMRKYLTKSKLFSKWILTNLLHGLYDRALLEDIVREIVM